MQRICSLLLFLFTLGVALKAQPTTFGTALVDGSYASYNLADRGAFRQVRLQAASSAGALSRNWNFAQGTAPNQNFFNNWRPYSGACNGGLNLVISGFNQVIAPDTGNPVLSASATFNSNSGGCDGFLPLITAGNYYTVNVTENTGDNFMAILETSFAPATVSSVSGPPCATDCGYEVTVTLSNAPAAGEYVYVRFSTDGFNTSGFIIVNFSGVSGTATIPVTNANVAYYVYTSSNSLTQLINAVNTYGEVAHDMLTLELANNSGNNYNYSTCTTSNPVAVCQNTTVQLNGMGNASITPAHIDGGSFDNCGLPSLSVEPASFSCSDVITTTPTDLFFSEYVEGTGNNKYLEIYNGTGVAQNLANYQVRTYSNGSATPSTTNTLSGILNPGEVIVLRNTGATIYPGAATVAGAVNFNGNDAVELYNIGLGATADLIGRIGEDPGTQWSAGGNSSLDQTLRRKSTVTGGVTSNPASGFPTLATEWENLGTNVIANLGNHGIGATVTLTATGTGGVQTSCLAVVTVIDATAPFADCQDITVDIETGGAYSLTAEDINGGSSDNCSVNLSIPATVFGCNDVGSTVSVTLTVTDDSGNLASCSADVTVADGNNICNQAPTALCKSVTVDANANCQGTAAAADFDGGSTDPEMGMLSFSVSPAGPYPLGTTNVTLTVTDPGSASDGCMTTITVVDNTPPSITCPGDFAVNIDAQCQALAPNFTGGPIVLANSVTEFSGTQGSGGWSYGQYFAFDAGNFSPLPTYNGGVPQWQGNQGFSTPFLDASGGHPGVDDLKWAVRRWVSPYTGTVDINLAFYDRDGNCGDGAHVRVLLNGTQIWEYLNIPTSLVTQSISQAISAGDVIDFVIDPKFDAGCDNTQFTVLVTAPNGLSASDNCGQVNITQSPAPGTVVGVGLTQVTLTASDGKNDSPPCTFNLAVIDNTAPIVTCRPATVQLDATGMGSLAASDVFDSAGSSDNCGTVTPQSVTPSSFSCSDAGSQSVTLTVSDGNGNTSTCMATVTVNAFGQELCGDGIDNNCDGLVDEDDPFAIGQSTWYADTDNDTYGDADNFVLACSQPPGFVANDTDCDDTDAAVNPAAQEICDGIDNDCDGLTDEDDLSLLNNTPPTAACQATTVNLNTSGTGSITAADVFDAVNSSNNCGTVAPQSVSPNTFSCADVGANTVTLTVNDGNGNTSTCMAMVTVEDPSGYCTQVVCLDDEIENLVDYVNGLGLNSSIARNITRRLEIVASKFSLGAPAGSIIAALNNIISYVAYQRGITIPTAEADYINAEIQALIDAINAGTAQTCSGSGRPLPPTTGVTAAEAYSLQAAPNPFSSETAISFYLPEAGAASLEVFNLQGQRVRQLLSATLDAGSHTQYWDGAADNSLLLSPGIYLVRFRGGDSVQTIKVSLVR